jgi:hypothetical protein
LIVYENFFHQENLSLRSLLFFSDKILKLRTALKTVTTKSSPHTQPRDTPSLNSFAPATEAEISKIILNSSSNFCDLDPIPMSHLKQFLPTLLSTLTNKINLFLATCFFLINYSSPQKTQSCQEDLSNYRPISHLSFLFKLTERVIKQRLTQRLSSNNLLNSFQSTYTKHH